MAGKHRAPKEFIHLGPGLCAGIVLSTAAAGSVLTATPAAAVPILADGSGGEFSPPAEVTTYEVVAGDCLSRIAPRFGLPTDALYEGNRSIIGTDPNLIFPGQVLTIAGSMASSGQDVNTAPQHAAPFQAPLESLPVTQAFKGEAHRGIDVGVPVGTPGYAVADGTVLFSRAAQGFGLWTVIRSEIDGMTVDFVYGHLDHLLVAEGDHVNVGDHVIDTGNNGITTGPHLHFEVWIGGRTAGHPVDPVGWLAAHGVNV